MRPDGIGRPGSLMASTWRSYQSFTAWLVPHTIGPASNTPAATNGQRSPGETPDEMIPHPNAHIGGNQVIGLSNSSTTSGDVPCATVLFISSLVIGCVVIEPEASKLDVKALTAEAEHLGRRGPIVAGQLQRGFDGELLDHIGRLPH